MKFRAKIAAAMAVAFAFATQTVHAQNVGVKANALSFAHTALGMGAEMSLGYHWSAELYGVISPWKRTEDKAKKYWAIQPEVRYWPAKPWWVTSLACTWTERSTTSAERHRSSDCPSR